MRPTRSSADDRSSDLDVGPPCRRARQFLHQEIHLHDVVDLLQRPVAVSHLGAAVAATVVVAGSWAAGARSRPAEGPLVAPEPDAVLLEHADCAEPRPASSGGEGNVSVVVPPTALVYVDSSGRVVAARTNTGCAPRPSDDMYVVRSDGTVERAAPEVASQHWRGDFRTTGALVTQSTPTG